MISLRFAAVLLLSPSLAVGAAGCFLDEAPSRDGLASSAKGERARSASSSSEAFMPREPATSSTRSQNADAGQARDASAVADGAAPAATTETMDASAQKPSTTQTMQPPDAGTQRPPTAGAPGAGSGGQSAMDAGAPAAGDAQVASDARPPTAADAGSSMTGAGTGAAAGHAAPSPIMPIHRYDFSGNGRVAMDLIGGKDAMLRGQAFLDTRGRVQLGQSSDDAVELPSRILAGLSGFTLVGWMELRADDCWRRLFDFIYYREGQGGNQGPGRGNSTQVSALYLTPNACPDNIPRLGYVTERSQVQVDGEQEIPGRRQVMLGAAYDSETRALQLIVDGAVVAQDDAAIVLRELTLSRGSLGSPTNSEGEALSSNISEFRIYDHALDEATLAEVARRGPDQL